MLRYEVRGRVALLTFDRPEVRNAWDVPMYRAIEAALTRANADPAVGALVFTNTGKVYCSGTNLKAAPEPRGADGKVPTIGSLTMAPEVGWAHLLRASKPSIAAVNGAAIGLGVTQLLPMDVRMGATTSTYAFPFLAIGRMPELGSTALLGRLVGEGRARDLCLSAATIDAAEALRIGLITRVHAPDALLDAALALGERIAGWAPLPLRLTRQMFDDNVMQDDFNQVLRRETAAFDELRRSLRAAAASTADPTPAAPPPGSPRSNS